MMKAIHMTTKGSRGEFTLCSPTKTFFRDVSWTKYQSEVTCKRCLKKLKKESK